MDIGGNRRFLPVTVKEVDYRTPVNHEGLYAQAYALLQSGFQYWYEGEEIERLNEHNEQHRIKDPVEENLFVYFRKATEEDTQVKWMPAAVILSKLSIYGKIQANRQTMQNLAQVLEKYEFKFRWNEQNSMEYAVIEFSGEQIEENFREQESKKKKRKTDEGELPF